MKIRGFLHLVSEVDIRKFPPKQDFIVRTVEDEHSYPQYIKFQLKYHDIVNNIISDIPINSFIEIDFDIRGELFIRDVPVRNELSCENILLVNSIDMIKSNNEFSINLLL